MPECHDDGSVCAALPVTIRSLALVHCEVHQSYTLRMMRTLETGGEPEVLDSALVHFGPFDSWYEIETGMREALEILLR